jgi:hypothetical protein
MPIAVLPDRNGAVAVNRRPTWTPVLPQLTMLPRAVADRAVAWDLAVTGRVAPNMVPGKGSPEGTAVATRRLEFN